MLHVTSIIQWKFKKIVSTGIVNIVYQSMKTECRVNRGLGYSNVIKNNLFYIYERNEAK